MQGVSTENAVESVTHSKDYWQVHMICGGYVEAIIVALGMEEVSIEATNVRCNCGKNDCTWNINLVVYDE